MYDFDSAFLAMPINCERMKMNESLNEASTKDTKGLKKELKQIEPLAKEYGYEYFSSMPFTNYDDDPTSVEYQYPEFFRIAKAFFKEMELLDASELNDVDELDNAWDTIDQHDFDTMLEVCRRLISKGPGSHEQFEKVFKNDFDDGLKSDKDMLADRQKADDEFGLSGYDLEDESLNEAEDEMPVAYSILGHDEDGYPIDVSPWQYFKEYGVDGQTLYETPEEAIEVAKEIPEAEAVIKVHYEGDTGLVNAIIWEDPEEAEVVWSKGDQEEVKESGEDFFEPWDHDDEDAETVYLYSQDYDGTPESLEAIRKDLMKHYVEDESDIEWVENIIKRIEAGDTGVSEPLDESLESEIYGALQKITNDGDDMDWTKGDLLDEIRAAGYDIEDKVFEKVYKKFQNDYDYFAVDESKELPEGESLTESKEVVNEELPDDMKDFDDKEIWPWGSPEA